MRCKFAFVIRVCEASIASQACQTRITKLYLVSRIYMNKIRDRGSRSREVGREMVQLEGIDGGGVCLNLVLAK